MKIEKCLKIWFLKVDFGTKVRLLEKWDEEKKQGKGFHKNT